MTEKPKTDCCPECGGEVEWGTVNAGLAGVLWYEDIPPRWWRGILSSKVEKLQRDWWGFPKLSKKGLPACRCRSCKLVILRYTADD